MTESGLLLRILIYRTKCPLLWKFYRTFQRSTGHFQKVVGHLLNAPQFHFFCALYRQIAQNKNVIYCDMLSVINLSSTSSSSSSSLFLVLLLFLFLLFLVIIILLFVLLLLLLKMFIWRSYKCNFCQLIVWSNNWMRNQHHKMQYCAKYRVHSSNSLWIAWGLRII